MGNDYGGNAAAGHELLQPGDGLNVQVVRGLVEEHEVRLLEKQLGKANFGLLPAGEALHRQRQLVFGKAEAQQHRARLGLVRQAAEVPVLFLQLVLLFNEFPGRVSVRRGILQGRLKGGHLPLQFKELLMDRKRLVVRGLVRVGTYILLQVADCRIRGNSYIARVGLFPPAQNVEQRRLARAVGPDETNALALLHGKGRTLKEGTFSVGLG